MDSIQSQLYPFCSFTFVFGCLRMCYYWFWSNPDFVLFCFRWIPALRISFGFRLFLSLYRFLVSGRFHPCWFSFFQLVSTLHICWWSTSSLSHFFVSGQSRVCVVLGFRSSVTVSHLYPLWFLLTGDHFARRLTVFLEVTGSFGIFPVFLIFLLTFVCWETSNFFGITFVDDFDSHQVLSLRPHRSPLRGLGFGMFCDHFVFHSGGTGQMLIFFAAIVHFWWLHIVFHEGLFSVYLMLHLYSAIVWNPYCFSADFVLR